MELEAEGMDAAALGAALATGHLTLGYLESAGRRFPQLDRNSPGSEDIGIPLQTLQTLHAVYVARRRGLHDNEAFEAAIREVGFRMGTQRTARPTGPGPRRTVPPVAGTLRVATGTVDE